MSAPTPEQTVRTFLDHLAGAEIDEALALLDPDVEWRNTSMPTFRGERAHQALRDMVRRGVGFEVRWGHVATTGDTVLTDRTDVLSIGPWASTIDVRGTFVVRDGRITVWDDVFSWLEMLSSGLVGLGRHLTSR